MQSVQDMCVHVGPRQDLEVESLIEIVVRLNCFEVWAFRSGVQYMDSACAGKILSALPHVFGGPKPFGILHWWSWTVGLLVRGGAVQCSDISALPTTKTRPP